MRRLDPWPVVADLFSGLLIATFAALVAFSVFSAQKIKEAEARAKADVIQDKVRYSLEKNLGVKANRCSVDDVCLSIQIQFDLNKDEMREDFRDVLHKSCEALKQIVDSISEQERKQIIIQIEGHTDQQPPRVAMSERDRYLYNWRLSGNRASSVRYEFDQCGLSSAQLKMVALGLADSEPICTEETESCFAQNRRTTFRVRPNMDVIRAATTSNH